MSDVSNVMDDNDSDEELHPIDVSHLPSINSIFTYDDPMLFTGILRAVVNGDLMMVEHFVRKGHSININDNHGNTPLHIAVIKNLEHIVDYLLEQDDLVINIRNFAGETPLFHAVKADHLNIAKKLIRSGANINLPNHADITPLHIAVKKNSEMSHLLIKNGANINAVDYSGDTPLHEAVNETNVETVCMLLYYNADADIVNDNNLTPFMYSILHYDTELQGILLEFVTDFNTTTCDGMSILALAISHNSPYLEEIINRGASVNFQTEAYHPLDLCLSLESSTLEQFEIIWKHYRGVSCREDVFTIFSRTFPEDRLKEYLNVVIQSENFEPFLERGTNILYAGYDTFIEYYCNGVDTFESLDTITRFTCCLLISGYQPSTSNFQTIFLKFGYCELCKIMLHVDFSRINVGFISTLVNIICDVQNSVLFYMGMLIDSIGRVPPAAFNRNYSIDKILILLRYVNYPRFVRELKAIAGSNNITRVLIEIDKLPPVPKLLELARNTTREHMVTKFGFTKSSQLYTYLNDIGLPRAYVNILTFEKPLY